MLFRKRKTNLPVPATSRQVSLNPYYEDVSEKLGIAQVILFLLLLAFVVISFLRNTGMITYRNFYYFFKDLNASVESFDFFHTDAVSYPANREQSFTLYRQGVAVAGEQSVTLFSSSGRQTISEKIQYQNPVAVGTGKYLLIYDLGGYQYALYNSHTCVWSGTYARPIRGADISDSGSYAIITDSAEYLSVVEFYNGNFGLRNRYSYQAYVTDVSIHAKGNELAVLISDANDGHFTTELRFYEAGSAKESGRVKVSESLGLRCSYTSAGKVSVLTGMDLTFLNTKGEIITQYFFDGKTLKSADLNRYGAALILDPQDGQTMGTNVMICDKNGKLLYRQRSDQNYRSLSLTSGALYLIGTNGVCRIKTSSGSAEWMELVTTQCQVIGLDANRFYLCHPQKAVCYRF